MVKPVQWILSPKQAVQLRTERERGKTNFICHSIETNGAETENAPHIVCVPGNDLSFH